MKLGGGFFFRHFWDKKENMRPLTVSTVFSLPWSISEESSKHDSCLLEEPSSTQPVKEGTCLYLFFLVWNMKLLSFFSSSAEHTHTRAHAPVAVSLPLMTGCVVGEGRKGNVYFRDVTTRSARRRNAANCVCVSVCVSKCVVAERVG